MKILPPTTEPPPEPTRRRHEPAAGRYQTYRACLRWDFGFTCPFCLLHEADVVLHGAEGFGVFQIEHREPQHSEAGRELVDRYENVLYICVLCNRSRWDRPVQDAQGRELARVQAFEPVSENPVFSFDFPGRVAGGLRLVGTDNNGNRIDSRIE